MFSNSKLRRVSHEHLTNYFSSYFCFRQATWKWAWKYYSFRETSKKN